MTNFIFYFLKTPSSIKPLHQLLALSCGGEWGSYLLGFRIFSH